MTVEEVLAYPLPCGDGNAEIWLPEAAIQHPLAQVEMISWDSSYFLLRARSNELIQQFQQAFLRPGQSADSVISWPLIISVHELAADESSGWGLSVRNLFLSKGSDDSPTRFCCVCADDIVRAALGQRAIFPCWGLDHGSAFAFLILRFSIALFCLLLICAPGRRWLPAPGTRAQVARTGFLLIGGYSIFYLLSLEYGVTPGVLATVMGVQPIITLLIMERHFSWKRLCGLLIALAGLTLVVYQSLILARFSSAGMACALAALVCMSWGAIMQKRIQQTPSEILPLQYAVSLLLCLLFVPFRPFEFSLTLDFIVPVLWLGLMIS